MSADYVFREAAATRQMPPPGMSPNAAWLLVVVVLWLASRVLDREQERRHG